MEPVNSTVWKTLLERKAETHKYDYGHVLVVGGSPGMVGSPLLVAMAALRIGAGLVTIASAPDVVDKLEKRVLEVMTLRIDKSVEPLEDFIKERKVRALAIGSGLSKNRLGFVNELLGKVDLPVVLDAGALEAHDSAKNAVLTPHEGELTRLLAKPLSGDKKTLAKELAEQWGQVVVLKGPYTIVAGPGEQVYVNDTGNPGLATAGTGDVLSGVIAGLLSQGIEHYKAATHGAYIHGLAGDLAAADKTEAGLIASDVVEYLPNAIKKVVTNITNP